MYAKETFSKPGFLSSLANTIGLLCNALPKPKGIYVQASGFRVALVVETLRSRLSGGYAGRILLGH